MAKIKINSLPPGFKLVDGKIVEDQIMREGGYVTGDQAGYGLVTLPQEYYNNASINTTRDESVRYSLSGVPRDKANIEAEGGETVLTDLNNDNQFGLYNITGPRHSKGGVPMYLPEQSFIYSDTDKMKFNKEELAEYGIETKSKMTPAQISKRYDLNKYYGTMQDQFADEITARSSELMLKKNMMGLSKLAFGQELKKKFEDGVPLAAHPYLVFIGEDPIEFTAKVENITKKQAQMKAFAALPPEQQQQLLQLQEMMAQIDEQQMQQPQQQEQSFEDPSMQDQSMQEQELAMADEDVMAMGMSDDQMAKYGKELTKYQSLGEVKVSGNVMPEDGESYNDFHKRTGTEKMMKNDERGTFVFDASTSSFKPVQSANTDSDTGIDPVNPLPKNDPLYTEVQKAIDSGKYKIVKGEVVKGKQMYKVEPLEPLDPKFIAAKEKQLNKTIATPQNQQGFGITSIYDENLSGEGKAIQENKLGVYTSGNLSLGNRPLKQSTIYNNQIVDGKFDPSIKADRKSGAYAFGSADIKTPEAKADFMDRWGDVVATIPGFDYNKNANDPQWGEFQKKAEETRRKEHISAFGSDKGYIPYWKEKNDKSYVSGEGFDSALGLRTFNAPRFKLAPVKPITSFGVDIPEERERLEVPPIQEYIPPQPEWWAQDKNNLRTLDLIDDNLHLPWAPDAAPAKIDYVLNDFRGRANAALSGQNTIAQALGAAGGPQAIANSNIQGETLNDLAQNFDRVNMSNVGIMNQIAPMQTQLDMQTDALNQARNIEVYNNTQKTLQNSDNFKNWKIAKRNELFNTALTNRANTYNLNSTYDYYAVDPTTGGPIYYKNGKALQKVGPQPDLIKNFYNQVADYERQTGEKMSKELLEKLYPSQQQNVSPDITNTQLELQRRGQPISYVQPQMSRSGKEIKRMVVPFYTGKMGS